MLDIVDSVMASGEFVGMNETALGLLASNTPDSIIIVVSIAFLEFRNKAVTAKDCKSKMTSRFRDF